MSMIMLYRRCLLENRGSGRVCRRREREGKIDESNGLKKPSTQEKEKEEQR